MIHYAECSTCRRRELLAYFDEESAERCEACDNCLEPRATYDGTTVSQKFLSCVYRIRQSSGFGTGMNHVIEVLTGAETEKVRRWNHHPLTTYGIGADLDRAEWGAIGRELLRLGYLRQSGGEFPIVEVTVLGSRRPALTQNHHAYAGRWSRPKAGALRAGREKSNATKPSSAACGSCASALPTSVASRPT